MSSYQTTAGSVKTFDVLVLGSGLAGLYYCLELIKRKPLTRIALITKATMEECNSRYAQGGIAAAIAKNDSIDNHIEDTLRAGDGLCYKPVVEQIIRQAPGLIRSLQEHAISFSTQGDGDFALGHEGGHSHRRILNTGDQTGLTVTETVYNEVNRHSNITFFEHHIGINLITHYHPHNTKIQGEVVGCYVLNTRSHTIDTFLANAVILATGGAGKTYRYTTNPMVATGDGVAMAYRAGARVGNMEFYQFHPTLLHHHGINNFLISEAVRGEGGRLINPDTGERFMIRYAPEQKELATRDVVARAIFNEIEQHQSGFVHLDITHQSKAFLKKRFPQIYKTLYNIGIDMSQDFIPVVPAAHYQCGGVLTNCNAKTDLNRLYAIGEVAFTGLHGANRLASNALLEGMAMAQQAAIHSCDDIDSPARLQQPVPNWTLPHTLNARRASQINAHWRGLRGEMTSYAGIVRTEAGLEDVLQLISQRKKIIEAYYWHQCITRDLIELRNIVLNAELIVRAALARRESRGGHYREDYPQKNALAEESIARMTMPHHAFIE